MSETRSLHRKLAEVMATAERIPKNGTAPQQMGGYRFVQVGDAADGIRKALGERHISMLPTTIEIVGQSEHETKSGGAMTTVELRITWTLTDGESGESIAIQSYGVGADTGDKYSGKATTNAMKYALLAGFLLSTGDDVEAGTDERAGAAQHRATLPQTAPQRPVAPPTPIRGADDSYSIDPEEAEWMNAPLGPVDPTVCVEHGVAWKGEPGDLYHRKDEGGYCRHPGNVKKPAGQRRSA